MPSLDLTNIDTGDMMAGISVDRTKDAAYLIGSKLTNGCGVLAAVHMETGTIVLVTTNMSAHPFATLLITKESGIITQRHYFDDIHYGVADMDDRTLRGRRHL